MGVCFFEVQSVANGVVREVGGVAPGVSSAGAHSRYEFPAPLFELRHILMVSSSTLRPGLYPQRVAPAELGLRVDDGARDGFSLMMVVVIMVVVVVGMMGTLGEAEEGGLELLLERG